MIESKQGQPLNFAQGMNINNVARLNIFVNSELILKLGQRCKSNYVKKVLVKKTSMSHCPETLLVHVHTILSVILLVNAFMNLKTSNQFGSK